MTDAELLQVARCLKYDKKKQGSHGRALQRDFPALGLLAGDRVEPSPQLPNVALLEEVVTPAEVVFWRPSMETMARHRNPLLDLTIGITTRIICGDPG